MKILIIRFSSIGDIVLTTPVVRNVFQQVKDVQIHYCTKAAYSSILEGNPYIFKLHFLKDNISDLVDELKNEKFDLVLDLHNNLRTRIIKFRLGVKAVSFNKLNLEKWLIVNLKINRLPKEHIVDRYLHTARSLGVIYDGKGLDYFIPAKDELTESTLPQEFQKCFDVYAIGGQHETKKLPLAKMMDLISKSNKPLILLGGKEDAENGIALELYGRSLKKDVLNLCGKLNLNQSASYVKHAEVIYTHDTGLMHIAAAFKKNIVTIWGNTIPEFGMYPFETNFINWEVKGLSCRPCSKIGYNKCPQGHFNCMNLQLLNPEDLLK